MMAKIVLEPSYCKKGNKLKGQTHDLLISERLKPTKKKGKYFLVAIPKTGKKQYISSIYLDHPIPEIEYLGIRYKLTVSNGEVLFQIIESTTKSYVYQSDLVSLKDTDKFQDGGEAC